MSDRFITCASLALLAAAGAYVEGITGRRWQCVMFALAACFNFVMAVMIAVNALSSAVIAP